MVFKKDLIKLKKKIQNTHNYIKKLKYVKTIKIYKILTQIHLTCNLSSNVGERRCCLACSW